MNSRFADDIDLAEIANACGSSPYHLSRIFKQHTGRAIFQYLISLRLRLAFERIVETTSSLTQIAVDCGFSSSSHLSNLFRREFEILPSRLRRNKPVKLIRQIYRRHCNH